METIRLTRIATNKLWKFSNFRKVTYSQIIFPVSGNYTILLTIQIAAILEYNSNVHCDLNNSLTMATKSFVYVDV